MPSAYTKKKLRQLRPKPGNEGKVRARPKAERMARTERIRMLIADLWSSGEIAAIIAEEFDISVGTANQDVAKELRLMREEFEKTDRPARAAQLLSSLEEDVRLARDADQHGASVSAKREIAKITGIYAPEQSNITVTGQLGLDLSKLSYDDRQRLRELLARARRD